MNKYLIGGVPSKKKSQTHVKHHYRHQTKQQIKKNQKEKKL